jgi:hypothetical protein
MAKGNGEHQHKEPPAQSGSFLLMEDAERGGTYVGVRCIAPRRPLKRSGTAPLTFDELYEPTSDRAYLVNWAELNSRDHSLDVKKKIVVDAKFWQMADDGLPVYTFSLRSK